MTDSEKQQIRTFAEKWADLYADPTVSNYVLTDIPMSDECRALGFEMDCGQRFCKTYGEEAFNDVEVLKRILSDVTDIQLLGSAVHSKWRYHNHWAYSTSELSEPGAREWFVVALKQLTLLAGS